MHSHIHEALLSALAAILRPTVKLLLQSGISFDEFTNVAKAVFVHIATDEYKRRGRPANFSQVSAMTGISRREVSKIRDPKLAERWTPDMETSPVNKILHQWHFDPDFSDGAGGAHALPFEGPQSFSALVTRHAGDIPPGAMKATLQKAGVLSQDLAGLLVVTQPFFFSHEFDEDFVRGIAFCMANMGSTMVHNAKLTQKADLSRKQKAELMRLERGVWSEHLDAAATAQFKAWVDQAGYRFLEEANHFIGRSELPRSQWANHTPRAVGVGLYYYEED
ncbi:MAG TPA: DUF6502 family protein [Gammaproteobacteria bacterium]|nr:DUF6502 family protein [Gammaproteobacteria bacterium]